MHTPPPLVGGNGASDVMPTNLPSDSNRWEGRTEATQDQEEQAVDNYPWVVTACPDNYDKAFVHGLEVEQAVSNILVEPKEILNRPHGPKNGTSGLQLVRKKSTVDTRAKSDITLKQAQKLRKECRQKRSATHDGAIHHQTR